MSGPADADALRLVLIADRGAWTQVAVTLHGVATHLAKAITVRVTVLTTESAETLRRSEPAHLTRWAERRGIALHWKPVDPATLAGLPWVKHIPPISFLRLWIPEWFADAERVVYLDCDVVVRRDLSPLMTMDLRGHAAAAVADPMIPTLGDDAMGLSYASEAMRERSVDPSAKYFNAGLLVIDPAKCKELGVTDTALDFARSHAESLRWADQDALNFALAEHWLELPLAWNVPLSARDHAALAAYRDAEPDAEGFPSLPGAPAVYHFVGGNKPWRGGWSHPYRKPYRREVVASGWRSPWAARFDEALAMTRHAIGRLTGTRKP